MTTVRTVTASFTRPNDTTAYTAADLVANSTTAGSVVPMTFSFADWLQGGMIRRARIIKSGTSTTNALFDLHLYRVSTMTFANGDNGAWSTDKASDYTGRISVSVDKAFTDGAMGVGVPVSGTEINFGAAAYYGVLEARAAYTPSANEVFTVSLEVIFD